MSRLLIAAVLLLNLLLVNVQMLPAAPRRHRARVLRMQATAFFRDGKPTAAGTVAHQGIVAADPAVLPLGSRIRISGAGRYNGLYTVTDTGGHIRGRRIDIFIASAAAARRFGRKMVTVQLVQTGDGVESARALDVPARRKRH